MSTVRQNLHTRRKIHQVRKEEPQRENSSLQPEHITNRMFLITITLKRVPKSVFFPPCHNLCWGGKKGIPFSSRSLSVPHRKGHFSVPHTMIQKQLENSRGSLHQINQNPLIQPKSINCKTNTKKQCILNKVQPRSILWYSILLASYSIIFPQYLTQGCQQDLNGHVLCA